MEYEELSLLSPFGREQVEKRRKANHPDLALFHKLRTTKANLNHPNEDREAIFHYIRSIEKQFGDIIFKPEVIPQLWNMPPKGLFNLRSFAHFEFLWRRNKKKTDQLRTKRGLSVLIKGSKDNERDTIPI